MDSVRSDRTIGSLCLCVTAFGWAQELPLMKLLLQDWPPLFARGLAGVCALLILGTLALSRKQSFTLPREAIPRLLFATLTTASEGALLAYTMPIWAMLFAWPALHTRPTTRDIFGLVRSPARCS